jgi:peptidoglycan L-alanyl-D-glutamate endopeptidase CwlK
MIADLAAKGLIVEVVQGMRTFAEQDELYAKGRTKPGEVVTQARGGESNHNYGLAVDLCPFTNDKPDWNAPVSAWAAIGAAAEKHGLEWGGQWKKFIDKPHVQLPAMTVKECARCHADGGMDAVWTTASQRIGWADVPREISRRARRKTVKRRKTTAVMRRRKSAKKATRRSR